VHFAGGRAVLCDVDRRTFTLSVEDAAQKLGPNTAALVPVHLFGNACDVHGIRALGHGPNLRVIWDAAQAHCTRYRGEDVGHLPDLATYSFYPSKNMTTGEGGMIVTSDEDLYRRCKRLREHGETRKYYHESFGFNYRMQEVSGALGIEQLKRLPALIEKRRRNAHYLNQRLAPVEGITVPFAADDVEHSFHQYSVLVDLERFKCSRDDFAAALKAEGVEAAVHYPRALNQQPVFAEYVPLPNCEWLSERIMSLPIHPKLSAEDLDQVGDAVTKVAQQMRR
jgi:perosamine synthetase